MEPLSPPASNGAAAAPQAQSGTLAFSTAPPVQAEDEPLMDPFVGPEREAAGSGAAEPPASVSSLSSTSSFSEEFSAATADGTSSSSGVGGGEPAPPRRSVRDQGPAWSEDFQRPNFSWEGPGQQEGPGWETAAASAAGDAWEGWGTAGASAAGRTAGEAPPPAQQQQQRQDPGLQEDGWDSPWSGLDMLRDSGEPSTAAPTPPPPPQASRRPRQASSLDDDWGDWAPQTGSSGSSDWWDGDAGAGARWTRPRSSFPGSRGDGVSGGGGYEAATRRYGRPASREPPQGAGSWDSFATSASSAAADFTSRVSRCGWRGPRVRAPCTDLRLALPGSAGLHKPRPPASVASVVAAAEGGRCRATTRHGPAPSARS